MSWPEESPGGLEAGQPYCGGRCPGGGRAYVNSRTTSPEWILCVLRWPWEASFPSSLPYRVGEVTQWCNCLGPWQSYFSLIGLWCLMSLVGQKKKKKSIYNINNSNNKKWQLKDYSVPIMCQTGMDSSWSILFHRYHRPVRQVLWLSRLMDGELEAQRDYSTCSSSEESELGFQPKSPDSKVHPSPLGFLTLPFLCARHCSKSLTYMNSYNPPKNPLR